MTDFAILRRSAVRTSVRNSLLSAFGLLVVLTAGTGAIGWSGFGETERALLFLQRDNPGDMVLGLELAEWSATLAAHAPYVASIDVLSQLDDEKRRLDIRLTEFQQLVQRVPSAGPPLPGIPSETPAIVRVASRLDETLRGLIDAVGDRIKLTTELLEIRREYDRQRKLGDILVQDIESERGETNFPLLLTEIRRLNHTTDTIAAAFLEEDQTKLDALQSVYEQDLALLEAAPRHATGNKTVSQLIDRMLSLAKQQSRIFLLRQQLIAADYRSQFLVIATNTLSVDLSEQVRLVTRAIQEIAKKRTDATWGALQSGKVSILVLGGTCLVAAIAAALYVMRNVAASLHSVTTAMTALAAGRRDIGVPATERHDEIGDLARAFNVFKTNAFERDELARRLEESAGLLRAVFENMNDGLSVFDIGGYLVAWNPQFEELTGLDPTDIANRNYSSLQVHLKNVGVQTRLLDGQEIELFDIPDRSGLRCEQLFPDGRVIELRSSPMPSGGFVMTYSDLTERKTIERQFRHAQKMEVVGQLTGGIAHDFNNLLAAIAGNLQMIHDESEDSPAIRRKALRALDAAERGATTTQRLLAFARQQALRPQAIDINELVQGMSDLLAFGLGAGLTLRTDLTAGFAVVLVDPSQLENALLNLVLNARDAMPDGGAITIRTRNTAKDGSVEGEDVVLSVVDTGHGMPPETLARVFEPFFTTKRFGQGSGLGLSMVYGFVRQSGGRVHIESEVGIGTKVLLAFPRVTAVPERLESVSSSVIVRGNNEKILVVEDDDLMRSTTVDELSGLGYIAIPAASAEEAIQLLLNRRFDLLFTDVILRAAKNGPEVAAEAAVLQPNIRILYYSGYAQDYLSGTASSFANGPLLKKPYTIGTLASTLHSIFHGDSADEQSAR